jgi:glycosyltransferase involved in cell wall biosynthesis
MTEPAPLLSIIIPAYNAADTLRAAVDSVFSALAQHPLPVEVLVVNDGSKPEQMIAMEAVLKDIPHTRLINHVANRGMCAARNTGIAESKGVYVTLLDADDIFVQDWPAAFEKIIAEWPAKANVIFTTCINQFGRKTCEEPDYVGWLTATDMVSERHSGEYNPLFFGDYVRQRLYTDLGIGKSCGVLTYLSMLKEGPFWISPHIMRRYDDAVANSVSSGWTRKEKAAETFICFNAVMTEHGAFVKSVAPIKHQEMLYKILIYRMLSGAGRDVLKCIRNFSFASFAKWGATLALLVAGPGATRFALKFAKRFNVLRRYG